MYRIAFSAFAMLVMLSCGQASNEAPDFHGSSTPPRSEAADPRYVRGDPMQEMESGVRLTTEEIRTLVVGSAIHTDNITQSFCPNGTVEIWGTRVPSTHTYTIADNELCIGSSQCWAFYRERDQYFYKLIGAPSKWELIISPTQAC